MANSVVVKIDGDDSGFKKSLSGIGSVAKKGLGVAVKGIAATSAALGGLSAVAIKSYAQYEQLIGGVDTLFKTSSEAVQKNAAKAYKAAGLSANEYMETAMSFAASLKQSFDDTEEGLEAAAKAADQAVIDMSDNANKMGTDMGLIQNAYQGFAKQNYTMLDNLKLGYGGTKTEMERLLKDAEKLSGIKYDISNLADVYEAIHVIQTELGITGTTAKEASETISGSIGMMSASWQNLVTGFANGNADLDSLMQEFLDSVLIVGKNLIPTIETTLSGVGKFISGAAKTLVPQIVDIIISTLPGLVSAAVELVKALGDAIIKNAPKLIDAAKEIVNILIEGIESAIPALKPFTSLLKGLIKNFEAVAISVGAVTTALFLYNTVGKATKTLTTAWTTATAALNAMEQAHALTLVASNGGLTLFQTLVGLVTGKITLQTAATGLAAKAQTAFNAAMTANPVGLVLVAVVALTAGLYALSKATATQTSEEAKRCEELKKTNEELKKQQEENAKIRADREKSASADLAQVEYVKNLREELSSLADENGNVRDTDRARAQFVLNELNNALGTEYAMTGNVISNYQQLQSEIDNLIEKKKLQILQEAALPAYEEAVKNQMSETIAMTKAATEADKLRTEIATLEAQKRETTNRKELSVLGKQISEKKGLLSQLETEYETHSLNVKQYNEDITNYETAETLALQGNVEAAIKALSLKNNAVDEELKKVKGNKAEEERVLAEAYANSLEQLAYYTKQYQAGTEGYTEDGLKIMQQNAEDMKTKAEEVGVNLVDGIVVGINGHQSDVKTAVETLANLIPDWAKKILNIQSPSRVMRDEVGLMTSKGFALGITGGKKDVEKSGKNLALAAAHSIEKPLGIHSPSVYMKDKVGLMITKGMAIGIKEGSGEVSKEFEKLFADLELQRDLDAISEEEYYERLTELRDKYLEAGTKEWWDYTQEIIDYNNELKDQVIEQMEDVLDKQEDFAKQLKEMSELYTESAILDEFGNEKPVFSLTDWEKENALLEGYGNTLDRVGERLKAAFGGDTDEYFELMQTIRDGGLEEGLQLATLLLDADDADVQKYVDGYIEHNRLSQEYAKKQYTEEMQSVALSVDVDVDFESIKKELEAKFGELPTEFFDVGADSADEFGSGFLEKLDAVLEEGRHKIDTMMSGAFFADTSGGSSASVVYSNTYVIQPAEGESTQKQLKEIRDSETMNKMRGGY